MYTTTPKIQIAVITLITSVILAVSSTGIYKLMIGIPKKNMHSDLHFRVTRK